MKITDMRGGRLRGHKDKQCSGSKKAGFQGERMGTAQQPAWQKVRTKGTEGYAG